jgi:hypothetical protein
VQAMGKGFVNHFLFFAAHFSAAFFSGSQCTSLRVWVSANFLKMDETETIYWKHISRNYLNPGYKRDLFTKPVPNLKQNGKNKKAF